MQRLISILIVDDEMSIRDGLKHMINWKKEGFHLIGEAENGNAALKEIQKFQPDIVITDLKMPQMDGIQLTTIIREQYPQIHFFVLSSYDDFHYVAQSFKNGAVDYLLKPTLTPETLLNNLKRVAKKIQITKSDLSAEMMLQESLARYLSGYESEEIPIFEDYFGSDTYYLLMTNSQYYQNADQLTQAFSEFDHHPLVQRSLSFKASNKETGFLFSTNTTMDILDSLSQWFESLKITEPETFFILSQPFSDLSLLRSHFLELRELGHEQHFFFKNQTIVRETDLILFGNNNRFDTKKFLRALLNNDFLLGITRIEDYFNEMILSNVSPSFLKQQASSIFYTLFSRIEEEFPQNSQLSRLKMTFLQEIGNINYLEEFSQLILSAIDQIRQQLITLTPSDEDELLIRIQRYILDHYNESLSLAQLAEVFHFSYNYLSGFFSAKFSLNFSEYLKKIRLEKAKQLLTQSDLNLSEISEAVGYSDLSYFSKLFKKEYQLTPSKYRRENQL